MLLPSIRRCPTVGEEVWVFGSSTLSGCVAGGAMHEHEPASVHSGACTTRQACPANADAVLCSRRCGPPDVATE
eukprot:11654800-Alexandrium_andersonii.AAC.1